MFSTHRAQLAFIITITMTVLAGIFLLHTPPQMTDTINGTVSEVQWHSDGRLTLTIQQDDMLAIYEWAKSVMYAVIFLMISILSLIGTYSIAILDKLPKKSYEEQEK